MVANAPPRAAPRERFLSAALHLAATVALFRNAQAFDLPEDPDRDIFLARLLGTSIPAGIYIANFLHRSLCDAGDVCEFGVAQGATSALLGNEIRRSDRFLWLYDSFDGLPEGTSEDELAPGSAEHTMASPEGLVHARLRKPIAIPGTSVWLRAQKAGNVWTQQWSLDGLTFNNAIAFTQALSPARVGIDVANYDSPASAAPAFTASVDYFH